LNIAEYLYDKNITMVGTIRENRREMPSVTSLMCTLPLRSTSVYKNNHAIVTLYKCKANKCVNILSTLHVLNINISSGSKKKPETVLYYSSTKYGVDSFDQMCRLYSTRSGTRRWPFAVYYNISDIAVINSRVIYKEVMKSKLSRRSFMLKLIMELCGVDEGIEENTHLTHRLEMKGWRPSQNSQPNAGNENIGLEMTEL
jgi:hypothetical protein